MAADIGCDSPPAVSSSPASLGGPDDDEVSLVVVDRRPSGRETSVSSLSGKWLPMSSSVSGLPGDAPLRDPGGGGECDLPRRPPCREYLPCR